MRFPSEYQLTSNMSRSTTNHQMKGDQMFKPIHTMTDEEINEELAYWYENSTDEQWWRDYITDLINQLKINANVKEFKRLQDIHIKRVEGEFDEKGAALVGFLGITMFVLYMLMTAVVLH